MTGWSLRRVLRETKKEIKNWPKWLQKNYLKANKHEAKIFKRIH
jgi:hypothetical protein